MSARQSERYYWLKLPNDFFDNHTLRILRGCEGGQYALLLYIELLAESVTRDGRLRCSEKVAYDEEMIASMFGFSGNQVKHSFSLLKKFELMVVEKDGTLVFPGLGNMVGKETRGNAQRREHDATRTTEGCRLDADRMQTGCKLHQEDKSIENRGKIEEKEESESTFARTREGGISTVGKTYAPPKHETPTWDEVLRHIRNTPTTNPISETFAREFYETASASEWRDTKGQDLRPGYMWKRKLQLQWNEELKEQRKANGGLTDVEKQREEDRMEEIRQQRLLDENGRDD